nr:uncharacterized protein LOC109745516 [Aegilops tauschii subsp. strangulata]
MKEEVEAEKAQLEDKAKVLAKGHATFDSLEQRSRKALRDLYGRGLKEPLVTAKEGPTELLPQLVMALEGIVVGVGPMVEGEACGLSTSAVTRVLSHLHLCDSSFDFDALLEPAIPYPTIRLDPERCIATAGAVKDQVEALLRKFLAVDSATAAGSAVDPSTVADGTGDGDVVDDGTPLAGDGSAQG